MLTEKVQSIHTTLALLLDGATAEQAAVIRSALRNLEAIGDQAEVLERSLSLPDVASSPRMAAGRAAGAQRFPRKSQATARPGTGRAGRAVSMQEVM